MNSVSTPIFILLVFLLVTNINAQVDTIHSQMDTLYSQVDTLYSFGTLNNRLTPVELDELLRQKRNKLIQEESKMIVSFEETHQELKKDSIIIYGGLHYIDLGLLTEEEFNTGKLNLEVPHFEFEDLDGNIVSSDSLRGKVVLLNFWFTRCAPCIAEMPYLNQIQDDYEGQDIEFISMAPEDEDQVIKFLITHDFQFQHIADADDLLKQFGVGFPKNILIDKSGIVRYVGGSIVSHSLTRSDEGMEDAYTNLDPDQLSWDTLRGQIDKLLGE